MRTNWKKKTTQKPRYITNHQGNTNPHHSEMPSLTPASVAITKNTCWQGCEEMGILMRYWWASKLVRPLWKKVWRFLKKLKLELLYDLAIPLPGIYLKKPTMLTQKDTFTPTLFTTAKTGKQPQCPLLDAWIKKTCAYTQCNAVCRPEREWNLDIVTIWMDPEGMMLSEGSQPEREKCHMISLICGT